MRKIQVVPLVLSIVICFSAAAIGSFFTTPSIPTWYTSLNKPFFNPPNWIFGPVWTILYLFMAISLYIIGTKKSAKSERQQGIIYFFIQLFLNTLWSTVFFGFKSPLLALLVIVALWLAIFITFRRFVTMSKPAGWLLMPYLAWVGFAAFLNLCIVLLNR